MHQLREGLEVTAEAWTRQLLREDAAKRGVSEFEILASLIT